MTEKTCMTCANRNTGVCMIDGSVIGSLEASCEYYYAKQAEGGDVQAGITCPNCGKQIDFRAGYINKGKVFICEKGKPLMREVRYFCRYCDSTVIFLKKCEPKWAGHD